MIARSRGVFAAAATLALVACHSKPPTPVLRSEDGQQIARPDAPSEEEEALAQKLLADAKRLESARKLKEADVKRETVLGRYPATKAAATEYFRRAQHAQAKGRKADALAEYEKLLFYRPDFPKIGEARQEYAALLYEAGRYQDAANMAKAVYRDAKTDEQKARVAPIVARSLDRAGETREALEIYVALSHNPKAGPTVQRLATKNALGIAQTRVSFEDQQDLWNDVRNDNQWKALQPTIAFRLAKVYYHVRDYERSQRMLQEVVSRYGESPYAQSATEFLVRLQNRFKVDTKKIGVALPLSGKYKQFGQRALAAIELAMANQSGLRLVVRDTQHAAPAAAKAVEELVLDEHVVCIIGPLFSEESTAAALKAEELSIPILTLSVRAELTDIGDHIFQTGLTIEAQAQALARLAHKALDMKQFAILHPNTRYGKVFANAFWDATLELGGEVRGIETYEHDQTTFTTPVRRLVGRHYKYARDDYRKKLSELRASDLPSHRKRAILEKFQKGLPPIVDFDAIVVPDSGRSIGLIVPAFGVRRHRHDARRKAAQEDQKGAWLRRCAPHHPAGSKHMEQSQGHTNVRPLLRKLRVCGWFFCRRHPNRRSGFRGCLSTENGGCAQAYGCASSRYSQFAEVGHTDTKPLRPPGAAARSFGHE